MIRPLRRVLAVAIAATLAAAGFAAASLTGSLAAAGRETTSTKSVQVPSELWRNFPLGPRTAGPASLSPVTGSAPLAQSQGRDREEGLWLTLMAGLAASGALVLATGAVLLLRQRQRRLVTDSRDGLLAIMSAADPVHEKLAQVHAFAAGLGCDMVTANRPHARGKHVKQDSEVNAAEIEAESPVRDYAQLGDRVAAVLKAAEEAAQHIRSEARTAAEQMTRQADQEARSLLEDSRNEAQRLRVDADTEAKNTREAVEAYATNHRREAEDKAARVLSEAEGQARASREAAEEMAQQIEERARTLEEEVREQERMIRGRMQRYLAALRDVSTQIEEVLGDSGRSEQTLVEALDVEQAKQAAPN